MTEAYARGESVRAQLDRVRLWLQRHRIIYHERSKHPDQRSRKLYVSNAEFEATVENPDTDAEELQRISVELDVLGRAHDARVEKTLAAGGRMPLEELRAAFGLSELEVSIVVALIAPSISVRIQRAYTNAWTDFTQKQTNVGFLIELLSTTWRDEQAVRAAFSDQSPLVRYRIVEMAGSDKWRPRTPLTYKPVTLSERIVDYLLEADTGLDPRVAGAAKVRRVGREALDELLVPDELKRSIVTIFRNHARHRDRPLRIELTGPAGCGKRALAAAMAALTGNPILEVEAKRLPLAPNELVDVLVLLMREAKLLHGDLFFNCTDSKFITELEYETRSVLVRLLQNYSGTVYVGADTSPEWIGDAGGFTGLGVPFPTFQVQEALWRRQLAGRAVLERGFSLDELVASYSLSGGAIERAADDVLHQARLRAGGKSPTISRNAAFRSAQVQLTHRLGLLAEKVTRTLRWDDLILPESVLGALRQLIDQYRHQNTVFNEWGFSSKFSYGRGLSALFHGPPGTGKTMVAGIIARELGLELYKIDLSRVVDKYIGETEKNLGRIFDEATRSNAILLFDEADSLFSKRTKVKSSHDRYANLETNFLLQRMETFDGVCLLTTNFEASIDDAFKRRLRFKIAFPFPEHDERSKLWETMIPDTAALARDVDYDELAFDFEMTGGHIKNAVLRAAFAAARKGSEINHDILYDAASEEYKEMGKLVREHDIVG